MKKIITASVLALAPLAVFAAEINDVNDVITTFDQFVSVIVWSLVSLAVLFIVWNAVQFIRYGGDGDKRKEYQNAIMWGIVGLAVILSIWGLVNIIRGTFVTDDASGQADGEASVQNLLLKRTNP